MTAKTTSLSQYLDPIRKRQKLVLIIAALVTVLAAGYGLLAPTKYSSSTSILVTPISNDPTKALEGDSDVDMATEVRISTSRAVIDAVRTALEDRSINATSNELKDNVSASSPQESKILDISYSATSPERASTIAETFGQQYLQYRASLAEQNKSATQASLNERISTLKAQLAEIESNLARTQPGTQLNVNYTVEQTSVKGELAALQTALADLSTLTIEAGEIITQAEVPRSPDGLGLLAILFGAAIAGLSIGVLVAYFVSTFKGETSGNASRGRRKTDRVDSPDAGQTDARRSSDSQDVVGSTKNETAVDDGPEQVQKSAIEKLATFKEDDKNAESSENIEPAASGEDKLDKPDDLTNEKRVEKSATASSLIAGGEIKPLNEPEPELPEAFSAGSKATNLANESLPVGLDPEGAKNIVADNVKQKSYKTSSEVSAPVSLNKPQSPLMPPFLVAHEPTELQTTIEHSEGPLPTRKSSTSSVTDPKAKVSSELAETAAFDVPSESSAQSYSSDTDRQLLEGSATSISGGEQGRVAVPQSTDMTSKDNIGPLVDFLIGQNDQQAPAITIVSSLSRGVSLSTAFELADILQEKGKRVLLIDMVLGEPVLHTLADLETSPGLHDVLIGSELSRSVQSIEGMEGLDLLTAGEVSDHTVELVRSDALDSLIQQAKQSYDFVLIAGGKVGDLDIAPMIDQVSNGIVVDTDLSPGEAPTAKLSEELDALGSPILEVLSVDRSAYVTVDNNVRV